MPFVSAPPTRYCPRAADHFTTTRTAAQRAYGPEGPHRARRHGGRQRAIGGGSRRRAVAGAASRHRVHPVRRPGRDRAAARAAPAAQGGLAHRAHRRRGPDGRQAEPGAAPRPLEVVDVARDRRGEEGRGRRRGLGRQHRRADGDGASSTCARMAGIERPAIAALWPTLRGESDRARCRRLDRRRRRSIWSTSRSWAARWRASCSTSSGRPSACSISASRRSRASKQVREAGRILREANLPHHRLSRLRRGRRHRQGHGRRRGHRRLCRQHRAQDRGGHRAADRRVSARRDDAGRLARKLGYLLARDAFRMLREKMDPRKVNGGVFLGLNGIVIKSHGGTDAEGFAAAIDLGYDMVRYELLDKISETLSPRTPASADATRRSAERPRDRDCVPSCSAAAAICRSASSPTTTSPRSSTPPTSGSCSAPASASATSRRTAS